jgi:hypothetical protein
VSAALLPAVAGYPGAAAATSGVHPGVRVTFGDVTCTVGAILHQRHTLYAAIPASCGGIDAGKVQDGCAEAESPVGIPVDIAGARHPGTLVYNSFTQMQLHGVQNPTKCYYDDLALVKIDPRDAGRVSGAIPGVDPAPKRVARTGPAAGTGMSVDGGAATAGSRHHHGWEQDFTTLGALSQEDVGSPVVVGNHLLGMLIVLPTGLLVKSPAEVYSLAKAMKQLHKTPGYRHVVLLRAGQRG